MTQELVPKRTPLTYPALCNASLLALDCLKVPVTRAAVRLVVAQFALESGMRSCFNFNVSGIKTKRASTKYDWQYFTTTERLTAEQVKLAQSLGPELVRVMGGDGKLTKVRLTPKHPWCCFRAFQSLQAAVDDHCVTLRDEFGRKEPKALDALLTGDPLAYAHALRVNGYYTAKESAYVAALHVRLAECVAAVPDAHLVWGDVSP
jgi:hypothetical protein